MKTMKTENRETFFRRLQPFFVPSVNLDIELAYTMAKFGHRAQSRSETDVNGQPMRYFEHVRRVALILIDEVQIVERESVIAALLHDGIEDTRDLTPAMIEHVFGGEVAFLVQTLSKVPKEGYLERFQMCSDWRAYVIKACDRLDNLRSMSESSKEFRQKQVFETTEKYFPLFEQMVDLVPMSHRTRAIKLITKVQAETTRQATLLEVNV